MSEEVEREGVAVRCRRKTLTVYLFVTIVENIFLNTVCAVSMMYE